MYQSIKTYYIMKRILVPTDFSQHAEHALRVAAQIARKNDGEIYLLHMLELPHQGSDALTTGHDIPEIMFFKNAAIRRLEDLMDADFLEGLKVFEVIQFEMAFDGILKLSKKNDIDLIVMGSHGASGYKEMFIGSNAEKVVRNSEVPVLVIKEANENFEVKNFVFASDFNDEAKKTFKKALEVAKTFGATMHLLTINTPTHFVTTSTAEAKMKDFANDYDYSKMEIHIYNEKNVEKGILKFAKKIDADLIGMSTHGRKGLAHFLNGSISEDLVNHSYRPVITFKI